MQVFFFKKSLKNYNKYVEARQYEDDSVVYLWFSTTKDYAKYKPVSEVLPCKIYYTPSLEKVQIVFHKENGDYGQQKTYQGPKEMKKFYSFWNKRYLKTL